MAREAPCSPAQAQLFLMPGHRRFKSTWRSGGSAAYMGRTSRSMQESAGSDATLSFSILTALLMSSWPGRNIRMSPAVQETAVINADEKQTQVVAEC